MRWFLIGLTVGAGLLGAMGCRAKHQAAESAVVDMMNKAAVRAEREVCVEATLERVDNIVVERPEIVIDDARSGRKVTVRGERLTKGRRDSVVVERAERCVADSTATGNIQATTDSKTLSEGKSGMEVRYILIVAIAVWVLTRLKKIVKKIGG